jgi:hypothetical protein
MEIIHFGYRLYDGLLPIALFIGNTAGVKLI